MHSHHSNALLIFAVDIRAGVTQQLQEQVYVAQTVSMMHIKTRIWQVCKQLPPPERRQVLINGGPGRDHELGISPPPPPPHVHCAVYDPDPCMTLDTYQDAFLFKS